MKRLKHESHPRPTQPRASVVVERADVLTIERDPAGVGRIEAGDQIEQGGLAGARLAHDGDVLTRRELQRNAAEHRSRRRSSKDLLTFSTCSIRSR